MLDALHERHLFGARDACEVWLIRHADAYDGLSSLADGVIDPPLSKVGLAQAERLADRLGALRIDQVWASQLRRARETAEAVASRHGLDVRTDPRLREVLTSWDEGRHQESWQPGVYPFPEPEEEVVARMKAAIADIVTGIPAGDRRRVAVVTHSGAITIYLGHLLGLAWGQMRILPYFTSISVLAVRGERTVVQSLSDATHLVALDDQPAEDI
jgi:probable phosphoglycerate mutase